MVAKEPQNRRLFSGSRRNFLKILPIILSNSDRQCAKMKFTSLNKLSSLNIGI